MSNQTANAATVTCVEETVAFLESQSIEFELVEHAPVAGATAEARVSHVPGDRVAKTVVLHDGSDYILALVPASQRLDLHKLRDLLNATRQLRLADEAEIAKQFPIFEVGAIPPFGHAAPKVTVMDRALLGHIRILCAAGDHSHSVLVQPRDVARAASALIADICEERR